MNKIDFSFTDSIAGYVVKVEWDSNQFVMKTSDGREYEINLTRVVYAEVVRNLGEAMVACTDQLKNMLEVGKYLFAYGLFYPEDDNKFDAEHIVFVGKDVDEFRFEEQDWWIKQIKKLADFYLKAQFGDGKIDYRNYRTTIGLEGEKEGTCRQETDTISRLVYGFATAYLMTGEERYLEAAEKGTKYLQEHLKSTNVNDEIVYWYHAIDIQGDKEKKIFASDFSDDVDAIPAYEQIYALVGLGQTYRVTGEPNIKTDIDMTINLFEKYFLDSKNGGYFTHIDPITLDPRSEAIPKDRARKNWNSNGDHVPAYLINVWLATHEDKYKKMLEYIADIITDHFPDYENSPFVQERHHEDWSPDKEWGWQQNSAIVGHNLKIAWNLMRLNSLVPKDKYTALAEKIAGLMPQYGYDKQRGGWYDMVHREMAPGEKCYHLLWHDRKTWWQQEQGILAYLILAGVIKKPEYLKLARESASFYNAWFLDTQSGAVYFNLLANGIPHLLDDDRMKGSHSQSGYHAFELAYLAAVYSNFLLTKHQMDFYFKPYPHTFKDNILRVKPDILPEDSIKIEQVWINNKEYKDFDAEALTVKLPDSSERVTVKVRIIPQEGVDHFEASYSQSGASITVVITGNLDSRALNTFKTQLAEVVSKKPQKLIFDMSSLDSISNSGARLILFEQQKLADDSSIVIKEANDGIKAVFDSDEFSESVTFE